MKKNITTSTAALFLFPLARFAGEGGVRAIRFPLILSFSQREKELFEKCGRRTIQLPLPVREREPEQLQKNGGADDE